MKPHSKEFRGQVLAACDKGRSTREVATYFDVSESWVRRIKQERRELNKTAPLLKRRRTPLWAALADRMRELIQQKPDLTLRELKAELHTELSVPTLCAALKRLRLTVKKSPYRRGAVTKPFRLGKTEVTQGQWKEVMGTEPWSGEDVEAAKDCPATFVSWNDATKFCQKLTEIERKSGTLKANEEYRLPTEAEWEYACRAGTTTAFSFGDDEKQLGEYAWFNGNTRGEEYAHKVGLKKPNPWGLYDMHGNVFEWCSDRYGEALSGGTDPDGPIGGSFRVLRGGGWGGDPGICRSANRDYDCIPSTRNDRLGFRVARSQSAQ